MKQILAGLIRHAISSGGASIALKSYLAGDKLTAAISGLIGALGVVLSVIHKLEGGLVKTRASLATVREGTSGLAAGAALVLLMPLLLTGCHTNPVPANRIVIHAPSGDYKIETPKNVGIDKFNASVASNGLFTVSFDKWTSTNDPQVIDKSYAGQAAVTKTFFEGFNALAGTVVEKAIQGAKTARNAPPDDVRVMPAHYRPQLTLNDN